MPADNGVDGPVERRAEDHGGHRREQTADAITVAAPGSYSKSFVISIDAN